MEKKENYARPIAAACGEGEEEPAELLFAVVPQAEALIVHRNGKSRRFARGSGAFASAAAAWRAMTEGAVRMPAFGVSIDRLTREGMREGLWAEFCFAKEQTVAGMPFTALLFAVKEEFCGFNVVRLYDGGYNGRCFYIDLRGGTMRPFAEALAAVCGQP